MPAGISETVRSMDDVMTPAVPTKPSMFVVELQLHRSKALAASGAEAGPWCEPYAAWPWCIGQVAAAAAGM